MSYICWHATEVQHGHKHHCMSHLHGATAPAHVMQPFDCRKTNANGSIIIDDSLTELFHAAAVRACQSDRIQFNTTRFIQHEVPGRFIDHLCVKIQFKGQLSGGAARIGPDAMMLI